MVMLFRGVDGFVVGTGDDKALNDDVVGAGGDANGLALS
jgi:hypothetical protein